MMKTVLLFRAAVLATVLGALSACGGGKESTAAVEEMDSGATIDKFGMGGTQTFRIGEVSLSNRACAKENGVCSFSGVQNVAYGGGSGFVVKRLPGPVDCNNATFGDPAFGVVKHCYLERSPMTPTNQPDTGTTSTSVGTGNAPISLPPATVPAVATPVFDLTAKPTRVEASRFLIQSTFGPNVAEIDRLVAMGYDAWLDEQFAASPMDSHWNYIRRGGPIGCTTCDGRYNINTVMESFWLQAIRGPDQLRQRTVFALSEMFVISAVNSSLEVDAGPHAAYLDMLSRNAFGNFRTLIEQVSTHPAMGNYLSHLRNMKEDAATGRLPDENFARELMQLFTIGLWELNEDGSRRKDANGNDIPAYNQADVMGMAKVMTGWSWATSWDSGATGANPKQPYEQAWDRQMTNYAAYHSGSEKRILRGVVIPASTSGQESLRIALDTLFNHPNVGPFVGSQLIKRFVTSNPSPAYVQRVSRVFADNGKGVRGDMRAVIRAVLTDVEARDIAKTAEPTWGKLREPLIRYTNYLRAFNAKSGSGTYQIWNTEDTLSSIGQNPVRAPSVFNWFRPDYAPPGALMQRGLVAPEFQITHETTVTGYANFMVAVAANQNGWAFGDYSAELALAADPGALVDRLNLVLMAGQMTAATRKTIVDAVTATPTVDNGLRRVTFAIYLVMQSPEYIVQK